jgi:hypothetical protein
LSIAVAICVTIATGLYIRSIVRAVMNPELDNILPWRQDIAILCTNMSLVFLFFSYKIITTVKLNFPDFYSINKKKLWFATIGLSFPMMVRVIWEISHLISPKMRKYVEKHQYYLNITFYILCYLLPISL